MTEPINPQDPEVLLASLLQFGKSQDGAVERDLIAAIRDLKESVKAVEARAERLEKALGRIAILTPAVLATLGQARDIATAALAKGEAD